MPNIHYTTQGDGFPVILIHGFCETGAIWDAFVSDLAKDFKVYVIDLPGFGKSPLPTENFNIDHIATMVYNWAQEIGLDETVIIGHSLGGYVTLSFAKQYPEILNGFGLFHSTALADSEEKKDSRNKTIEFVRRRGVEVFAHSFVPSLFYHKNRNRLSKEIDTVVKTAAQTREDTLVAYTKAMRDRHDRTDVLSSFEGPILFIAGDKDTSVPLEKIDQQILLPKRAIVHVLEDTGHMGMFEKKDNTLQEVKNFVKICL